MEMNDCCNSLEDKRGKSEDTQQPRSRRVRTPTARWILAILSEIPIKPAGGGGSAGGSQVYPSSITRPVPRPERADFADRIAVRREVESAR